MKLTPENYYTQEANEAYMSASFVKGMRRCEAATIAELRGEYTRENNTALTIGSYVDVMLTGTEWDTMAFRSEHPEMFKKGRHAEG